MTQSLPSACAVLAAPWCSLAQQGQPATPSGLLGPVGAMVLLVVLLLALCVVVLTLSRFWRHRLTDHRRMDADRVASVDPWAEAGRRCHPDAGDAPDDDDDDDDDQTDDEYGDRFEEEQW